MSMSILSSHLYSGPLAYATAEFTLKKSILISQIATKGNKKYTGALKKQKVFNRTKQKQTQLFLQADKLNNHSVPPCHKAHMWESPTITLLKYIFQIRMNIYRSGFLKSSQME